MCERGIMFRPEMVRAIIDGRKTQTRRLIKMPRWMNEFLGPDLSRAFPDKAWTVTPCLQVPLADGSVHRVRNPWMWPNEPVRLWVRETWRPAADEHMRVGVLYRADNQFRPTVKAELNEDGKWRPSLLMPRWASRITLEVVGVRAERLQDITEDDARAEGCDPAPPLGKFDGESYAEGYAMLWERINGADGPKSWAANPWVWCVEFKRVGEDGGAG